MMPKVDKETAEMIERLNTAAAKDTKAQGWRNEPQKDDTTKTESVRALESPGKVVAVEGWRERNRDAVWRYVSIVTDSHHKDGLDHDSSWSEFERLLAEVTELPVDSAFSTRIDGETVSLVAEDGSEPYTFSTKEIQYIAKALFEAMQKGTPDGQ